MGGAVYNAGSLSVTLCSFCLNAVTGGPGIFYSNYPSGTQVAAKNGGDAFGGAIGNGGTVDIQYCFFASNSVVGGQGSGGRNGFALDHWTQWPGDFGGAGGRGSGAALYNDASGTATLRRSILVGNTALGGMGGNGGAGYTSMYSASPGGSGGAGGASAGGAIAGGNGCWAVDGTLAGNLVAAGNGGAGGNGGFCQSGSASGGGGGGGGSALGAGMGASHAFTMALLGGSPALDAGDVAVAPPTDQRGLPRFGAPDIGAYEYCVQLGAQMVPGPLGGLRILATGRSGQSCQLLRSANLTNWIPVTTKPIAADGTVTFVVQPADVTRCFFRVVCQ